MHKSFYASGFLYHSPSQQILLQQYSADDAKPLALFRARGHKGEDPVAVFQRFIQETLGISLKSASIVSVYDYVHDELGDQFIFYVDTKNLIAPPPNRSGSVGWYQLAKLSKLNLAEQTRHDIIISERVIRAAMEKKQKSSSLN